MENKKYIDYWVKTGKHDFDIAETLYQNKKYDACLFFCHLMIEKLLKGFFVKYNKLMPQKTHNLIRLCESINYDFEFTEETKLFLVTLTEFNIESRYPDYRLEFYKMCNKKFTTDNFNKAKELFKCLLEKI